MLQKTDKAGALARSLNARTLLAPLKPAPPGARSSAVRINSDLQSTPGARRNVGSPLVRLSIILLFAHIAPAGTEGAGSTSFLDFLVLIATAQVLDLLMLRTGQGCWDRGMISTQNVLLVGI